MTLLNGTEQFLLKNMSKSFGEFYLVMVIYLFLLATTFLVNGMSNLILSLIPATFWSGISSILRQEFTKTAFYIAVRWLSVLGIRVTLGILQINRKCIISSKALFA